MGELGVKNAGDVTGQRKVAKSSKSQEGFGVDTPKNSVSVKNETSKSSNEYERVSQTVHHGEDGEKQVSLKSEKAWEDTQEDKAEVNVELKNAKVEATTEKKSSNYGYASSEVTEETDTDGTSWTIVETKKVNGSCEETNTQVNAEVGSVGVDVTSKTKEQKYREESTKVTVETKANGQKQIIIEETVTEVTIREKETVIEPKIKASSDPLDNALDIIACIPAIGCVDPKAIVEKVKEYKEKAEKCKEIAAKLIGKAVPIIAKAPYQLRRLKEFFTKWTNKKQAKTLFDFTMEFTSVAPGKVKDGAKKDGAYIALIIVVIVIIKREEKKANLKGKCFTGDTLVLTKSGLCPIRQIRTGDEVCSRNDQTKETAYKKVKEVFQTEAHTIYHIRIENKAELKTTAYHPIFVREQGWVNAINLQEGMLVETKDGTAEITDIEKIRQEEPVEVFNFHVEDWEAYFVSEQSVYVHNSKGGHTNEHPHGIYEDAPYHGKQDNPLKSKRPKNGQAALDKSLPLKDKRRIAVDQGEFVVLTPTSEGVYHGHVRPWKDSKGGRKGLDQEMKNVLLKAGLVNRKGKILK
uniref:Hint domain-containing protein n=1 Tax=Eubacterium plexicaudatum ASF492 TaxID=1235802 RepID=N2ADW8_9FIRM